MKVKNAKNYWCIGERKRIEENCPYGMKRVCGFLSQIMSNIVLLPCYFWILSSLSFLNFSEHGIDLHFPLPFFPALLLSFCIWLHLTQNSINFLKPWFVIGVQQLLLGSINMWRCQGLRLVWAYCLWQFWSL